MQIEKIIGQARDAVGVRRIFGDPHEQDGVTIIPAASIRGASGGGGGEGTEGAQGDGTGGEGRVGSGGGAGFGLVGRPVGAFVIQDGEVSWRPAIDVTGIVLRALLLGGIVFFIARLLDLVRN